MPARKWTDEQKARQAALIRTWQPWTTSTGPKTPKGKTASSKNAVNYSCREVTRELARTNRALLAYLAGVAPKPSIDQPRMDKLLDAVEKALNAPATARKAKAKTASASKPRQQEPADPPPAMTEQAPSFWDQIPSALR